MSIRRADFAALALLALLALAFFWPVTLGLGWIPSGGGDLASFLWPSYTYASQSLRAGHLPLWNPTLYGGGPFAADNQTSLFYPVNLIVFLLAPTLPYTAMEWLVVFHFWVAGAGMYFCLRALLADEADEAAPWAQRVPALFAAVAFMFSDVLVIHVGNLNTVAASAWLPAEFGALHLALTRRSAGWAASGGALLGVGILAGQMHMTIIGLVGLGLYGLWQVVWGAGQRLQLVGLGALFAATAVGLTAFVLLPAVELTSMTARTQLSFSAASAYAVPWSGLAGLFSPLVFGRGPLYFWGPWDRVELGYLGVLPLLLAGLAAFKSPRRAPLFLAGLAAFALIAALGASTPLYRLIYEGLPVFSGLRGPSRFMLLGDFSLAALGGLGLHNLDRVAHRRAWAWGLAVAAAAVAAVVLGYQHAVAAIGVPHVPDLQRGLAVMLALLGIGLALVAWGAPKRWAPVVALAVLAADLIGLGNWVEVDQHDPTLGFQHPQVARFLESQPGPTRIDNASGAWAPDAAAPLGLEDINGLSNPLSLAAYQTYLGAVGSRGSPLYNFLNVQFVVADKGQPPGDATLVPVFSDDPAVDVYLNTKAMPRVSLVYSATVVADGPTAFGAIHTPGFDPAQAVVVENGPALTGGRPEGASNLYYTAYAPEADSVVAVTPAPAYLVFSEVWYPGWRVWVDGVEAPIYRADFAFRGVWLPSPGTHTVEMRYDPWSWKVGGAVSLATLIALVGLMRFLAQRARDARHQG
jgi:hypothetical protein